LSFSINIYETSLGNIVKHASGEVYNVSRTSFINIYTNMTASMRSFLLHDISAHTDQLLDTVKVSTGFHACRVLCYIRLM